jgi:hypothetical protein
MKLDVNDVKIPNNYLIKLEIRHSSENILFTTLSIHKVKFECKGCRRCRALG